MGRFIPHEAKPKTRLLREEQPLLYFTPDALLTMQCYVEECSDEVGWLGVVRAYENDLYLCSEAHLLYQEVNGATTEINPEGLVKFAEEIGLELMEDVKLWGHSHVNMGTGASSQDDKQMEFFNNSGHDWFFRIICNKKGSISVTFYNYKEGYIVEDVPWDVLYPVKVDVSAIKAEIKEKVTKKQYSYGATNNFPKTPIRGLSYVEGNNKYKWSDKWEGYMWDGYADGSYTVKHHEDDYSGSLYDNTTALDDAEDGDKVIGFNSGLSDSEKKSVEINQRGEIVEKEKGTDTDVEDRILSGIGYLTEEDADDTPIVADMMTYDSIVDDVFSCLTNAEIEQMVEGSADFSNIDDIQVIMHQYDVSYAEIVKIMEELML
jgi:NACalpha-BTF3-like transcription factor